MNYESLLQEATEHGLNVKEKPLQYNDGRIKGNRIAIRKDLQTTCQKSCVLAEELGHHYTTYGNILDQSDVGNRKQELLARTWAYDKMIGLSGIISCFEHGCHNRYETAEYLEVTEEFLDETIDRYRSKYGTYTTVGKYIIYFIPNLTVCKMI